MKTWLRLKSMQNCLSQLMASTVQMSLRCLAWDCQGLWFYVSARAKFACGAFWLECLQHQYIVLGWKPSLELCSSHVWSRWVHPAWGLLRYGDSGQFTGSTVSLNEKCGCSFFARWLLARILDIQLHNLRTLDQSKQLGHVSLCQVMVSALPPCLGCVMKKVKLATAYDIDANCRTALMTHPQVRRSIMSLSHITSAFSECWTTCYDRAFPLSTFEGTWTRRSQNWPKPL